MSRALTPALRAASGGAPGSSRSGACSILLVLLIARLFAAEARHLPHRLQLPARSSTAVDQRAAGAGRDDPDAANQFDLSVGFDPRHLAGAGDRPAAQQGLPWPVAFMLVPPARRLVGLVNGLLVTRVEDRLLHRHARHRHRALRPQRLVHRRPAGHRPSCRRPSSPGLGDPWSGHSGAGSSTCSIIGAGALDRVRVPAARPLPLRHRRQPARGGAQRHLGPALRHARLRRRRARSPPSPASSCRRSSRSARAPSARR